MDQTKKPLKGIDVAHHQGAISWKKVKADGIGFAMIRSGYGWDDDQQIDRQFYANVKGAQEAGLPFGLYHYSYALSPAEAEKEARWFLRLIGEIKPAFPVAFDFEEKSQLALPPERQIAVIDAFMSVVEAAKFYPVLYMSASPMERLYTYAPDRLGRYDRWIAHVDVSAPAFSGSYGMWQYSWKGRVDGIATDVDLDYAYQDYPSMIRAAGYNGWEPSGSSPETPGCQALLESERALRVAAERERDSALAKLAQVRNVVL